jgi:hypothetical protein
VTDAVDADHEQLASGRVTACDRSNGCEFTDANGGVLPNMPSTLPLVSVRNATPSVPADPQTMISFDANVPVYGVTPASASIS